MSQPPTPAAQPPGRPPKKPPEQRAMIVDAWIHPDDLAPFHRMRSRFFPGHRNFLSAHVTLFHYIRPVARQKFIDRAGVLLPELSLDRRPLETPVEQDGVVATHYAEVKVLPPFALGRKGVAYRLEAEPLLAIRTPLRDEFEVYMKYQDRQKWGKPHITVQNKSEREVAARLLRHLQRRYQPCSLRLLGIGCYRYDYGPWTYLARVPL